MSEKTFGSPVERRRRKGPTRRTDIEAAQAEEARLREAALGRLRSAEERIAGEAQTLEGRLRAEQGRAFSAAVGRRAGRAMGGGALAALSGTQADLSRQAAEARSALDARADQAAMDRIQFERETMKTSEQMTADATAARSEVNSLADEHTSWGFLNKGDFRAAIKQYLFDNGIPEGSPAYRAAIDQGEEIIRKKTLTS